MYKSYYYLNRLILELNTVLTGKKIISIFSQEKDRLIIQLDGSAELLIEISVNHSEPYINVRKRYSRAKKNTIEFFSELAGKTIKEVLIASDDRIIKFVTDAGELFFAIRGKYTNLFFNSDYLVPFKNESQENLSQFRQEFEAKYFHKSFNIPESEFIKGKSIEEIRNRYRFIGREIENEVNARKINNESDSGILLNVLQDIFTEAPAVYVDENLGEVHIGFNSLKIYATYKKLLFDTLIEAFNQFLIKKYQYEEKKSKLKKVESFLDRELRKISSRLNNLLIVIEKGSQEEQLNKIANLLLINLHKIQTGLSEIEVDDIYSTESKVKIKLDTKLSAKKNIDRYFEKSRDSKINFEKSKNLYLSTKKEFDKITSYQLKLKSNPAIEELDQIMKELKIKDSAKPNQNDDVETKFKHYLVENKYHVFVGKDSSNNDFLTTRFAKQNDYWFHARSVPGSHVVLRIENSKEAVPKSVLKKAASIAAYHSKAKTAGVVPVTFTLKKFVVKRKGQPIGQVSLLKEQVLLVKPEIPSDVEYLTE
jgi:predicted ribosome quality control (RQC) complex YloA/Tae2 family protein